jgi:phosphoglycolate phosphatase-like HAD superfamily hydrolase
MILSINILFHAGDNFLALDFDGVIADSIEECLIVGCNAYGRFTCSGDRIHRLEALGERHQMESRRLRNFIRSAEDYVYLQLAIGKGAWIRDQSDYDAFVNEHADLKATFYDLFYKERELFFATDEKSWMELNPLYEGMKQFLLRYPFKDKLFIITTKQIKYADKILKGNQIDLKQENCFSVGRGETKLAIVKTLLDKKKIPADAFFFIDDQVDTLVAVKESGVRCILAKWGYASEAQILRAGRENIPGIGLEDFLERFSKP